MDPKWVQMKELAQADLLKAGTFSKPRRPSTGMRGSLMIFAISGAICCW